MNEERKKYIRLGIGIFLLYLVIYYWKPIAGTAGRLLKAAAPLLTGCGIAYVLNILMSFYEKHYFPNSKKQALRKSARPVCMSVAFLTLILIIALVVGLAIPVLVSCVKILCAVIPEAIDSLAELLSKRSYVSEDLLETLNGIDWDKMFEKVVKILTSGVGSTLTFAADAVSSVVSKGANIVIGSVFAAYLLLEKEHLKLQCKRIMRRYLRPSWNKKINYIVSVTNNCFHSFIVGQCTEAAILGILCMLGMLIFRFPYAIMTGTVVGVTALVPIIGAFIGGAVGFFLILGKSPMKAFLFLIYLIILQQLEDKLIYPKVVGASLGLPGMWVMATVTVGGSLFGIAGMLFGLPLAATIYQLIRNDVNGYERLILTNEEKR